MKVLGIGVDIIHNKRFKLLSKKKIFHKTNNYFSKKVIKYNPDLIKISKKIYTAHRVEPLKIEIWKDKKDITKKDLIIFMPGLGGDISNFRWIGRELSKRGWAVLFIDHKGSNSNALLEVLQGNNTIPSSADFFLNRIKDLDFRYLINPFSYCLRALPCVYKALW